MTNDYYFVKLNPNDPPILCRTKEAAMNLAKDGNYALVQFPAHKSVDQVETYTGRFEWNS